MCDCDWIIRYSMHACCHCNGESLLTVHHIKLSYFVIFMKRVHFFKYISDCYTNIVAVGQLSANMNRIIGTFQRITISKFKKEIESHVSSSFSFSRVNRWRTHMMQWICSKNSLLRWDVSPNYYWVSYQCYICVEITKSYDFLWWTVR